MQALTGCRVLDLSRLLPGPYLTMVLADLGAEVVKIEDPGAGDYLRRIPPLRGDVSGRYLAINRGKRSLRLDLKSQAGRAAFLRMAAQADVVVESFRPGVMQRLGIGYETLRAENERLVYCAISGFGQTGAYRERAGHDLGYVALTGMLGMSGSSPEAAPQMPGTQVADMAGGALWSLAAILAALLERARSGQGRCLDISMTEGALALLAPELGNMSCETPPPSRGSGTLNGGLACYSVYRCSDGRYLAVAALEPKFWIAFNTAIGRAADLAELLADADEQARIRAELQAILATRSRDQWLAIFSQIDCCCEPVLELDEVSDHPLHQSRQLFFEIEHPTLGALPQLRTPLGTPANRSPPPGHGEHSRAVLQEYGFSAAEVADLCNE